MTLRSLMIETFQGFDKNIAANLATVIPKTPLRVDPDAELTDWQLARVRDVWVGLAAAACAVLPPSAVASPDWDVISAAKAALAKLAPVTPTEDAPC